MTPKFMASSSGVRRVGLDHLRAIAAFMVFSWHFVHVENVVPLDGSGAAWPPLSLFSNGYMGVSLFMVLSGYLFGCLTEGRRLIPLTFFRNRVLRLLPLLAVVFAATWGKDLLLNQGLHMGERLLWGWLLPTLPAGAWSITVELHFYLLLPALLWLRSRGAGLMLLLVVAAVCLRAALHWQGVELQGLSYLTMVGRIDQFVLGLLAAAWRRHLVEHRWIGVAVVLGLLGVFTHIDRCGSMFSQGRDMAAWWVAITTLEGVFFAWLVAWYDVSNPSAEGRLSRCLQHVGDVSYSIYLWHTFFVFVAARWLHRHVIDLSNVHVALCVSLVCFVLFLPFATISHRVFERPFLRMRRPATVAAGPGHGA